MHETRTPKLGMRAAARGAHAAGVPFSAARRKLRATHLFVRGGKLERGHEGLGGPPNPARGPRALPHSVSEFGLKTGVVAANRAADFPVCGIADFQIGGAWKVPRTQAARTVRRLEALRHSRLGSLRYGSRRTHPPLITPRRATAKTPRTVRAAVPFPRSTPSIIHPQSPRARPVRVAAQPPPCGRRRQQFHVAVAKGVIEFPPVVIP